MAESFSLYNTFGNDLKTTIIQDTLVSYLENSTIKFVLPEASTELLTLSADQIPSSINPNDLDQVSQQLVSLGYGEANALALAVVLIRVAKSSGVNPLEYFKLNQASLSLAAATYDLINEQRPVGNRIGLVIPTDNSKSPAGSLIKP